MELALNTAPVSREENQNISAPLTSNLLSISSLFPCRTTMFFGGVLCALQALDGIFTAMGISQFGTEMEGNAFLRHLMEEFGHVPTLAVMKLLAMLVVVFVTMAARKVRWAKGALLTLSCVYLCAAIIPWTYILFINPIA